MFYTAIFEELKIKILTVIIAFGIMMNVQAAHGQELGHSTYYLQKSSHFSILPKGDKPIVFLGNSITDGAEWKEVFPHINIINRGISGDVTSGVLDRLPEIVGQQPQKLFLLIGINDLAHGISKEKVFANILTIVDSIKWYSPFTQIYVQSLLPVNNSFAKFKSHTSKAAEIKFINAQLEIAATNSRHFDFIDLYPHFLNSSGKLDSNFTNDGLHLTGKGYLLWKHLIYANVYGLQKRPSIIPMPAQLQWRKGEFPLHDTKGIYISSPSLHTLAAKLISQLPQKNIRILDEDSVANKANIRLLLDETADLGKEAYELEVGRHGILLKGKTMQGLFYGLQTLFQLMRDKTFVPACHIIDKPAFAWRGLMHDLGRNFIPLDELKKQIDVMARYKYNVLHLHLTEDIAWRLGIKAYPELTAASNMQRNAGMYYSLNELKDLVAYCKARYITLVSEIDMPGHSDAFTRAFGVDMQSVKGKELVKDILKKVGAALDVPYFHIGGDEVRIKDKSFLPEMSKIVNESGKEVIAWLPGGNVGKAAIRQLWASPQKPQGLRVIDSRHLYLNHIDPLGGIVKIFNRQLCDVNQGDSLNLGGEICIWPDHRPYDTHQIMLSNAVYPAMLAFAERSWQGGGYPDLMVNLGSAGSKQLKAFRLFEKRLLDHKKQYFLGKVFPYAGQSQAKWQLAGPFENNGELKTVFAPETNPGFWEDKASQLQEVFGSTIWMRHFFAPYMQGQSGYLKNPKENSTCYAYAEVYSPAEKEVNMWISFHNPSRSENDDTAPLGKWDYKESKIWLNGKEIAPPNWSKPGRNGEKEAPYIDESFELRPPHKVNLKKGWNKVMVKLPVGKFSTTNTRLVKWMFSVAFIENINGQWRNAIGIRYKQ